MASRLLASMLVSECTALVGRKQGLDWLAGLLAGGCEEWRHFGRTRMTVVAASVAVVAAEWDEAVSLFVAEGL